MSNCLPQRWGQLTFPPVVYQPSFKTLKNALNVNQIIFFPFPSKNKPYLFSLNLIHSWLKTSGLLVTLPNTHLCLGSWELQAICFYLLQYFLIVILVIWDAPSPQQERFKTIYTVLYYFNYDCENHPQNKIKLNHYRSYLFRNIYARVLSKTVKQNKSKTCSNKSYKNNRHFGISFKFEPHNQFVIPWIHELVSFPF